MTERRVCFGDQVIDFYENLDFSEKLPRGVSVLNPCETAESRKVVRTFYEKYFSDQNERVFVLGINPGRYGAGITGISFTDPHELQTSCEIPHNFSTGREISARFMYEFIATYGGSKKFYKDFYLTSICPVGFVKGKKNYNYYDDVKLLKTVKPFIVASIKKQLEFGARKRAIILGTGKNQVFFTKLNAEYHFFEDFVVLEHPRYIMQYKTGEKDIYLRKYQNVFQDCLR